MQAVGPHAYARQEVGGAVTHCPSPSHEAAGMACPAAHEAAAQVVVGDG